MTLSITHNFVSTKPQGTDNTKVYGPQWNDTHAVSGTLDSAESTYTGPETGTVQRTVSTKLTDFVSVKDFGAVGDGVADDTTAIQAFFNAITTGKSGFIPSGHYLFKSTLTLPTTFTSICGTGKYSSVFVYGGATTTIDLLTMSGILTADAGPAVLSGFGIKSNTVMTAGVALHITSVGHLTTRDVALGAQYDIGHNLWNGIYFQNTDFQLFEDFEIQVQNEGLQVSGVGAGNTGTQYDLWCEGGKVAACAVGVHIGGGFDNAYFDRMMVTSNGTNVLIDNALQNFKNQEIGFGPQFVTDQATNNNYLINDTLANQTNYGQISIFGPVTGSHTANGINIQNWPNCFVNVASPYIANNNAAGIFVQDASAKVLISTYTNIVNNGGFGISSAFATTVSAPCFFSGNSSGSMNSNTTNKLTVQGGIVSNSPTTGVGYATGAGGTVTQLTSRTTGVTLNTVTGNITMFSAAGSATPASFTVTNSSVAGSDVIVLNTRSGASNAYNFWVSTVAAGSFTVTFWTSGGTVTDAPLISFAVIKAVTS